MDSIFRLDSRGNIMMNDAAIKLLPEFEMLTDKQARYLVLAYDSANTVFKQQPISLWPKLACKHIFGHENFGKEESKPEIKEAIEMFKSLVYDENRVLKAKYIARKKSLQEELLTAKGAGAMKAITESISIMEKMINELDAKISFSDEEVVLASKNGKLSMLEKYQLKLKNSIK
jgi:hypothetical protein